MLMDDSSIVVSPHRLRLLAITSPGPVVMGGSLLVRWMTIVSPGHTCSVGDSRPSCVLKQKSVRPALSSVVQYSRFTSSFPALLNKSGGGATSAPGVERGQTALSARATPG